MVRAHTDVLGAAMAEAADPLLAQDYARRQQQQQSISRGRAAARGAMVAADANAGRGALGAGAKPDVAWAVPAGAGARPAQ